MYDQTVVKIDISAGQAIDKNKQVSARTKHIDFEYHYVKDALEKVLVVLRDALSADNLGDMMTKILDFNTLKH